MKTLRAFWHWVDNDKPTDIRRDKLSKVALEALLIAESQVATRAFGPGSLYSSWAEIWLLCSSSDGTNPNARPEFFRPELVAAVRDLSLAICPALEAMRAAVPEPVPDPRPLCVECHKPWTPAEGEDAAKDACRSCVSWPRPFAREYIGEWLPAAMPTDTFRGVDRSRDEISGLSAETQAALQQRNEYEQRALAIQAVDATHPRNRGGFTDQYLQQLYLDAPKPPF